MTKEKVEEKKIEIPDPEVEKLPEGYTAEEWKGLSDAEKEGILSGLSEGDEVEDVDEIAEETLKEIVGEEEPEKTAEELAKEKADEEALAAKKKADEEAEAKRKADEETAKAGKTPEQIEVDRLAAEKAEAEKAGAEPIPTDDQLLRYRPIVTDEELPSLDEIPADIQTKFDQLDNKLETGEITQKEYFQQQRKVNSELMSVNIRRRETAKDQKTWDKEQAAFLRARPEYLDKSEDGEFLWNMLGATVKSLGAKYDHMELLLQADRLVKEKLGSGKTKGKEERPTNKGKEVKVVAEKPAAKLPDHKTLADVPTAGKPEVGESWATALDKLHGEAYEAALEKLTPEQRDRYLNTR
jgi:hypothetical protein